MGNPSGFSDLGTVGVCVCVCVCACAHVCVYGVCTSMPPDS